jgi:hypothetical protein
LDFFLQNPHGFFKIVILHPYSNFLQLSRPLRSIRVVC